MRGKIPPHIDYQNRPEPWNKGLCKIVDRKCLQCGESFKWEARPSRVKAGWGKFCSHKCSSQHQIKFTKPWLSNEGKVAHNKGAKYPKNSGIKNNMWKGNDAGYFAKHDWVKRHWGSPDTCEFCGKSELKSHKINWSNKDHKYTRDRKEWQRLCASCHKNYDLMNGLCNR